MSNPSLSNRKTEYARQFQLLSSGWKEEKQGKIAYNEDWKYSKFKADYSTYSDDLTSSFEVLASTKTVLVTELFSTKKLRFKGKARAFSKLFSIFKPLSSKTHAFHSANVSKGFLIIVPENSQATVSTKFNGSGLSHTLIILGKNSRLNYSHHFNAGPRFSSSVVETFLEEDAVFAGSFIESGNAELFSSKTFSHSKNSSSKTVSLSLNGSQKAYSESLLNGENALAENYFAIIGKEKDCIDLTVNSVHNARNTSSKTHSKACLWDSSEVVFRGGIIVTKKGAGSVSSLYGNALLVGENAKAHEVPLLDIKNNDVQAAHGASAGKIGVEDLFYVESRGIEEEHAKKIFSLAFLNPILEKSFNSSLRKNAEDALC